MSSYQSRARRFRLLALFMLAAFVLGMMSPLVDVRAEGVPQPNTVTLVGSLAVALGCTSDAQLDCDKAQLTFNEANQLWQASFDVPAGEYAYTVALDGSADKQFGAGGTSDGEPITLTVDADRNVSFVFNTATGYV